MKPELRCILNFLYVDNLKILGGSFFRKVAFKRNIIFRWKITSRFRTCAFPRSNDNTSDLGKARHINGICTAWVSFLSVSFQYELILVQGGLLDFWYGSTNVKQFCSDPQIIRPTNQLSSLEKQLDTKKMAWIMRTRNIRPQIISPTPNFRPLIAHL